MTRRYQRGARDLADEPRQVRKKYEVGARLRYLGPSDDVPPLFTTGDELIVCSRNRGGDGISARRADGVRDMVWPWEVGVLV